MSVIEVKPHTKKLKELKEKYSSFSFSPVYENDKFNFTAGGEITHKPELSDDRGELVCFYMIGIKEDGTYDAITTLVEEIDIIIKQSSVFSYSAKHDYDGIAFVIVTRMFCAKFLNPGE